MSTDIEKAPQALQQLVADSDTGGRKPTGWTARVVFATAMLWALFQYWYASPLPFELGIGILNDTEARAIHRAFALFLAFLAWPAFKRSPRHRVPWVDWLLALVAAFCGAYIMLFYAQLATRPGQPNTMDIVVGFAGVVLLLEATRRAVGWPMAALAVIFLAYCLLGPHLPDVLSHKGASVNRLISHMWLTTEGVYGIALGVSAGTIFVYVLFGALLDRAGGGNYMMQVSFAALGHLRGGPAKVAVVSSALNGMISGSSVSNVVSGGIFTIPLMALIADRWLKRGAPVAHELPVEALDASVTARVPIAVSRDDRSGRRRDRTRRLRCGRALPRHAAPGLPARLARSAGPADPAAIPATAGRRHPRLSGAPGGGCACACGHGSGPG